MGLENIKKLNELMLTWPLGFRDSL